MPPLEFLVEVLIYGGLVPAAVTALLLALAVKARPNLEAGGGAALAGGVLAGHALLGVAPWAPNTSWHWLPYLPLIAAAASLGEAVAPSHRFLSWGLRIAVAALASWLLVPTLPELQETRPYWLAGSAVAVLVLWAVLQPLARKQSGPLIPSLLLLVAMAGAVVIEQGGFGKLAQFGGVLAAALGGCAVVCGWRRDRPWMSGVVPGVALLLTGLVVNGYFYNFGDVPPSSYVLILVAPLGLAVGALPFVRRWGKVARSLLQTVAVVVPAGLAVAFAMTS